MLLLVNRGRDDPRTTGEMKWGEGWDEDDVVQLVAWEEEANRGNEGYGGKESESIWSGGKSLKCGSPARNWATWRGGLPHFPRGQIRGMSGTAERMGHRVVGGAAIWAGGVIDSKTEVGHTNLGLEPQAIAGTELGEGAAVWQW